MPGTRGDDRWGLTAEISKKISTENGQKITTLKIKKNDITSFLMLFSSISTFDEIEGFLKYNKPFKDMITSIKVKPKNK